MLTLLRVPKKLISMEIRIVQKVKEGLKVE